MKARTKSIWLRTTYTIDRDELVEMAKQKVHSLMPKGTHAHLTTEWSYDDDGALIALDIIHDAPKEPVEVAASGAEGAGR